LKLIILFHQWRQRLDNFGGGWIDAMGKVPWGTEDTQWGPGTKTQWGVQWTDPKADTYFGNGRKTDILGRKNRKCIHVSLFF